MARNGAVIETCRQKLPADRKSYFLSFKQTFLTHWLVTTQFKYVSLWALPKSFDLLVLEIHTDMDAVEASLMYPSLRPMSEAAS